MEYSTIKSEYLAREASASYQVGKGFYYENVILQETFTINKATDSIINHHINLPSRSMTGILCLFTEDHTAGARDSEKFVNPDIKSISFNIWGMPNALYSKGMLSSDLWESVKKRFGKEGLKEKDFYNDKFALWVDLRTHPEESIHGAGLPLDNEKDGIKLAITRKVGGSGTIKCYVFVVADACMTIIKSGLDGIVF